MKFLERVTSAPYLDKMLQYKDELIGMGLEQKPHPPGVLMVTRDRELFGKVFSSWVIKNFNPIHEKQMWWRSKSLSNICLNVAVISNEFQFYLVWDNAA